MFLKKFSYTKCIFWISKKNKNKNQSASLTVRISDKKCFQVFLQFFRFLQFFKKKCFPIIKKSNNVFRFSFFQKLFCNLCPSARFCGPARIRSLASCSRTSARPRKREAVPVLPGPQQRAPRDRCAVQQQLPRAPRPSKSTRRRSTAAAREGDETGRGTAPP